MSEFDALYIYYISGTGNARLSSEWIAGESEKMNIRTVVQKIDRLENIVFPEKNEKCLIGFAFPTHGFNAAPIMIRFISGFPPHLCREVFLLNTRAGMKLSKIFLPGLSGLALVLPALILRLKGYRCTGFRPVDLPSNWIPLHPGLRQKVIESIIRRCEPVVRDFGRKVLAGKKVYRGLCSLPVDLLISPVAAGYYFIGRFFLSKTFMANTNCNNCGICIRECPTSSIKLVNNRPYWKLTCESCMRCLNHCPERAIEATHGMAALFLILISSLNTWLIIMLAEIMHVNPEVWWWKITHQVTAAIVTVFGAAALYMIMHYLMGFKAGNYLVRFTSFTTLPFWRRYKYLKSKKISKQDHSDNNSNSV